MQQCRVCVQFYKREKERERYWMDSLRRESASVKGTTLTHLCAGKITHSRWDSGRRPGVNLRSEEPRTPLARERDHLELPSVSPEKQRVDTGSEFAFPASLAAVAPTRQRRSPPARSRAWRSRSVSAVAAQIAEVIWFATIFLPCIALDSHAMGQR